MPSTKDKKSKRVVDTNSSSDGDESGHELFYYAKDRVKLMKEVLKLIKPKKIKTMAPDCIKNSNIVEINSMLLEELLGISNKRLRYIFNGENVDRETSSSESEEETQPIDVISLDDISDDDDIEICLIDNEKKSLEKDSCKGKKPHKVHNIKKESTDTITKLSSRLKKNSKKVKLSDDSHKYTNLKESEKERLMSVLELLELQARARAIRSQLAIETENKDEMPTTSKTIDLKHENSSDSDVIVESPKHKEIVISSSDSEQENSLEDKLDTLDSNTPNTTRQQNSQVEDRKIERARRKEELLSKIQKIRLSRNKTLAGAKDVNAVEKNPKSNNIINTVQNKNSSDTEGVHTESILLENKVEEPIKTDYAPPRDEHNVSVSTSCASNENIPQVTVISNTQSDNDCETDEIVINLDEDEMDGMEND